jgi:hypothetical protein
MYQYDAHTINTQYGNREFYRNGEKLIVKIYFIRKRRAAYGVPSLFHSIHNNR